MSNYSVTGASSVKGVNEPATIALTPTHAALLDQLVERESKRLGESPERVRRAIEIGILTRGIAAVQEDGS